MTSHVIASGLQLDVWSNAVGLIVSVPPLVVFMATLIRRVKQASPRIALHEFILLIRRPWHVILILIIAASTAYLIVRPTTQFPASLAVLIPIVAILFLLASFFLAQSRQLSGAVILNEMSRMSKETRDKHKGVCAAIRFDIDRLKAVSNQFPTVGERIRATVDEVIKEEVGRLRKSGVNVLSIGIPGEDETVVIAAGISVEQAADFADEVRRRVKRTVKDIPYYDDAVQLVVKAMQPPSGIDEEREGIGTVSAGVAADRGLPEILLSDVSAAVKESKTRGRNKTVIYRPGQTPEVRSDFKGPATQGETTTVNTAP